jgi:hypothetical protein
MLSTITPFGERSRGHRYASTAAWFITGSVLGGVTLGVIAAGSAAALAAAGVNSHPAWVVGTVAVSAGLAASADAGVFGDLLPLWRRQVDEKWLVRYRSWVYGLGFGWQMGVGVATYIMTAGVFLVVVLAAVSADPRLAAGICALFGLVRGLAVLLSASADSPARLRSLHRRFDAAGPAVRWAVIGVQVSVALLALAVEWPLAGTAAGLSVLALVLVLTAGMSRARRVLAR